MADIDTLFQIVNALNQYSSRKDYQNIEIGAEINQINTNINDATNLGSINNLINALNSNSSTYSNTNSNKFRSENVKSKALAKKASMNHYKNTIDSMTKKYEGTEEHPGFKNLDENDILDWSYESLSDELLAIRDFEAAFYEDYEKTKPVNYIYNSNIIRTDNLRRRVDNYKKNIFSGLEALRGDNLISDYELPFVVSGDKAGLATSSKHYGDLYTKQFNSNNRAIGAIKGNIAKLEEYIVKKGIDKKSKKGIISPDEQFADYIQSNINLHDHFGYKWEADSNLQNSGESKESYTNRMIMSTLSENPMDLVTKFRMEIQGYEGNNKIVEREFHKWKGFKMHASAVEPDFKTYPKYARDKFNKEFGTIANPWVNRNYPKSKNEIPLDLETDIDSGHYYSQSKGEYYDKETIDDLYNL